MAENGGHGRFRAAVVPLLPSVIALVAVGAFIAALLAVFGAPSDEDALARSAATRTAEAEPQGTRSAPAATGSAVPSSTPWFTPPNPWPSSGPVLPGDEGWAGSGSGSGSTSGSASGSDSGSGSSSGSGSGSGSSAGKERASGTQGRPLPVYVLNQTTRRGLAADVAEDIESAGWSIAKVSWWRGVVPSTTVYYPPGYEDAAQALSAAFPAINRIRPRVDPMPDDALTVILCKEYPEV